MQEGFQVATENDEIARIAEAMRARIEETTLRDTAGELGMSPAGLRLLASRSRPHGATMRRARAWFAGWNLQAGHVACAVEAALETLAAPLPEQRREAFRAECRRTLARHWSD